MKQVGHLRLAVQPARGSETELAFLKKGRERERERESEI